MRFNILICLSCISLMGFGQTDSLQQEEDFSMYENLNFADECAKRFCTPKVFDLSPAKLISIGFDHQGAFDVDYGHWKDQNGNHLSDLKQGDFQGAGGLRISANIPVISKTNVVLQAGINYARTAFYANSNRNLNPLDATLKENGLSTAGLSTTLFKPFNEEHFMIVQASADLNGDYATKNITPIKYTRYSSAIIFGKKKHDRKMIGFGLSRTYRVGELNYIPVMLLNWTAPSRKWGVEMLAPARVNIRKTISPRNILLFGYELEGNSYRILHHQLTNGTENLSNIELRRSELRIRATWEASLYQFIWMSLQVGYRYGYSFNLDQYNDGKEFFRGFTGDQPYLQENKMNGTWYAQLSLNLVSP